MEPRAEQIHRWVVLVGLDCFLEHYNGLGARAGQPWEMLGLQPDHLWGTAAALSEFGGGVLTALGLLHPLGPIGILSAMMMATGKAHWGKPIWVTAGGAELPVLNSAVAVGLMLTGPGEYAMDEALRLTLPSWLAATALLGAGALVGYGLLQKPTPPAPAAAPQTQESAQEEARTTVQGGEGASASSLP